MYILIKCDAYDKKHKIYKLEYVVYYTLDLYNKLTNNIIKKVIKSRFNQNCIIYHYRISIKSFTAYATKYSSINNNNSITDLSLRIFFDEINEQIYDIDKLVNINDVERVQSLILKSNIRTRHIYNYLLYKYIEKGIPLNKLILLLNLHITDDYNRQVIRDELIHVANYDMNIMAIINSYSSLTYLLYYYNYYYKTKNIKDMEKNTYFNKKDVIYTNDEHLCMLVFIDAHNNNRIYRQMNFFETNTSNYYKN